MFHNKYSNKQYLWYILFGIKTLNKETKQKNTLVYIACYMYSIFGNLDMTRTWETIKICP